MMNKYNQMRGLSQKFVFHDGIVPSIPSVRQVREDLAFLADIEQRCAQAKAHRIRMEGKERWRLSRLSDGKYVKNKRCMVSSAHTLGLVRLARGKLEAILVQHVTDKLVAPTRLVLDDLMDANATAMKLLHEQMQMQMQYYQMFAGKSKP